MVSVAIDGPAGAGKSTLARRLAAEMGYIYVDTGAMFRTIGLYALRKGVNPKDNAVVNTLLPEVGLRVDCIDGEQHIYLNGEDVSTAIRTEEAGMAASAVGANPEVRAFLLELQRGMTKTQNVLMDGRDIGTVVLPDATVKIFLTAAPEARARRRWLEYQQKGMEVAFEDVLADVKQRDYQDTHRAAAPLKQAEDAVLLDTSDLNFEQSLAAMKEIIAEQLGVEEDEITPDTSFKEDLGADSLDLFELTMALEEEYDTEIPAEELEDIETVGDVIEYLREKGIDE